MSDGVGQDDLESEGISPDLVDEGAEEGWVPPGDAPLASIDHGVTAREHREGGDLESWIHREQPDVEETAPEQPGRLMDPESGLGEPDTTAELVADESDDRAGLSPEEAAMHIEETRPPD